VAKLPTLFLRFVQEPTKQV